MALDRFQIDDGDRLQWGRLVKQWVKHEKAWPRTLDELKAQCLEAGMQEPRIPDYITGLMIMQYDKHILMIRLPPQDLVEASENAFREDPAGGYALPSFYAEFFRQPPPNVEQKLELHAARIGEYSVNSCM